jgi:hypothetical protein
MKYLTLSLILVASISAFAQKAPPWVDYNYRTASYPDAKYLIGFATEINIDKSRVLQANEKLNQMARNQIIESIHVSIQAESQMNISVENTATNEAFEQSSKSASKAELVGLKFENYYDKKAQTAYAFSYVLIQDIITYYLDVLETNYAIINKNFAGVQSGSNKNTALGLLYDAKLKLKEVDQATVILTAMKQSAGVDFNKITGMKKQVEDFYNEIFSSSPVNAGNIGTYFHHNLTLQVEKGSKPTVCLGSLQYKDSGAESDFSQALKKSVFAKMGSDPEFKTVTGDKSCNYLLTGSFGDSDNEVIIQLAISNAETGDVLGAVNRSFLSSALALDGQRLLPPNFERIKDIPTMQLIGSADEIVIKTSEYLDNPLEFNLSSGGQAEADLPVMYSFSRNGVKELVTSVNSDKSGKAQYFINKEAITKSGEFELTVQLDIANFLGLDPASSFYKSIIRDYPPQVKQVKLKLLAPTVFVSSNEMNLGQEMGVKILAPAIKNALLDLDYKFVDSEDEADFVLEIEASTREGQSNQYMFFSYLDATIAMHSTKTGKEIYKNGLSSVKGGGSDYKLASVKAYEKAKSDFLDDFIKELRSY